MEFIKYQYDFDVVIVIGFLWANDLMDDFKINVEVNYVIFVLYIFQYELQIVVDVGLLGSIDVNWGDYQNGWDIDQFLVNIYEVMEVLLVILEAGGLQGGGINFDVKIWCNSIDLVDLFYVYIGGMDVFVWVFLFVDCILQEF